MTYLCFCAFMMLHVSFEAIGLIVSFSNPIVRKYPNQGIIPRYPNFMTEWAPLLYQTIWDSNWRYHIFFLILDFANISKIFNWTGADPSLHMKTVNACKGTALSWVSWQNIAFERHSKKDLLLIQHHHKRPIPKHRKGMHCGILYKLINMFSLDFGTVWHTYPSVIVIMLNKANSIKRLTEGSLGVNFNYM